jgi:hypothetical protein
MNHALDRVSGVVSEYPPAIAMVMTRSGAREKIVKYERDAAIRIPLSARKHETAAFVSGNTALFRMPVDGIGVWRDVPLPEGTWALGRHGIRPSDF